MGAPLMLTPWIKAGRLRLARLRSKIHLEANFLGHSGYITVPSRIPEKQNNNVFFWFQPCTNNCDAKNTPFLLWLQGGPGAPGTFGCLSEIGNYYVHKDMKLRKRCFSWCEKHNCLFVDQPTMTGFSFPTNSTGKFDPDNIIYTKTSPEAMEQVYQVIQQVYTLFPQYQLAPFYITGESYGGIYCGTMGMTILHHNKFDDDIKIDLKAVMVGDPMMNAYYQLPTYASTLHGMGVIMEDERDRLAKIMRESIRVMPSNCTAGFLLWNSVWNDDGGGGKPGLYWEMTGSGMTENVLLAAAPEEFDRYTAYFKPMEIQKAFHCDGNPSPSHEEGGAVYHTMVKSGDWCTNSSELYAKLFLAGIDVMIYSSTSDPLLGPPTTEAGVQAMWDYAATQPGGEADKVAYEKARKYIWKVDDKDDDVAGYAKCFENHRKTSFCYTVIRNAGHESPSFEPRANYDMFLRFLQHRSFSSDGDDPTQIPKCAPCGGAAPFAGDHLPACQD